MRTNKENLHTILWALTIIIVIPIFFGTKIKTKGGNTQFSQSTQNDCSENSFAEPVSENVPENALFVVSAKLEGNVFKNSTKYEIDERKLSFKPEDYSETIEKGLPLVLIIHTYGSQAYLEKEYITANSTLKSEDENLNVISAGAKLKDALEKEGIKAIHHKELFDKISYSGAYSLSSQKVLEYIEKYPTIKFVFDIQRDSLFTKDGKCVKAVTTTEKGKTAQILFISGSDENGADFPQWKTNLSLSMLLSQKLSETEKNLSRGVSLLPSGYGQYTCSGYVTVKLGTAGNTPKEAENASAYLAEALCEVIMN